MTPPRLVSVPPQVAVKGTARESQGTQPHEHHFPRPVPPAGRRGCRVKAALCGERGQLSCWGSQDAAHPQSQACLRLPSWPPRPAESQPSCRVHASGHEGGCGSSARTQSRWPQSLPVTSGHSPQPGPESWNREPHLTEQEARARREAGQASGSSSPTTCSRPAGPGATRHQPHEAPAPRPSDFFPVWGASRGHHSP